MKMSPTFKNRSIYINRRFSKHLKTSAETLIRDHMIKIPIHCMNFLICLPRLKSGATDILFLLDISQNLVIEHLQTSSTRGLLLFYHMTNFIISKSDSVSVLSVGHGLASYAHG